MSKRMSKHTLDERIDVVLAVIANKKSVHTIAKEYDIYKTTIESWVRKYQEDGVDGLKETKKCKKYSNELKRQAVNFYLNEEGSLRRTCEKFSISDPSVL